MRNPHACHIRLLTNMRADSATAETHASIEIPRAAFTTAPPTQVLGMLGSVGGQRVVELGAGIGRFTGELARAAAHVLAVDFMENLIAQNREANAGCTNVEWRATDATTLQLPAGSFDVVFSNWLLMYLADEEVAKLAADSLRWVRGSPTYFDASFQC